MGSLTEAYKVVWTGRCDWDCDSVLARIARLGLDEPGSICPGLRVQILETDSDAVYPDSRLPPDHYWRLGWSCAALTRGEIIFTDRGCENESSEFSRWWRN